MRAPLVLALAGSLGCGVLVSRSDKAVVADFAAERIYQVDRYERLCQKQPGKTPAGCAQMEELLNRWKDLDDVAGRVQLTGKLPTQERAELESLIKRVRELP